MCLWAFPSVKSRHAYRREQIHMEHVEQPRVLDADELVEEIVTSKGRHQYTQGLSEDNWEEELEHIPLFMTKAPDVVDPVKSPGLAALQDLKYQEGTPTGRATAFKEDGNELFRTKHYSEAVVAYSEAIKQDPPDSDLNAVLYSNRAAANYHLENYRKCINDALQARKFNPRHIKAVLRGAEACYRLERYSEAVKWCDDGLKVEPGHVKLTELRVKCVRDQKRLDRDQRKNQAGVKRELKEGKKLLAAIKARDIHMEGISPGDDEEDSILKLLSVDHSSAHCVAIDGSSGGLVWSVLLLYPEYGQSDIIQAFGEEERFIDHIQAVLSDPPPWDHHHQYTPSTVQLYYKELSTGEFVTVDNSSSLRATISSYRFTVVGGVPTFFVLSKASSFQEHFLRTH